MSNTRIPILLKTNIRKLDNKHLDSDADVLRCQSSITSTPKTIGQGEFRLSVDEEKAVYRAFRRTFVDDNEIVVKVSKNDILVKNARVNAVDLATSRLIVLTVYEGQTPPPSHLKDLDYSSLLTLSKTSVEGENVSMRDAEDTSDSLTIHNQTIFKRIKLPGGYLSSSSYRWHRTATIDCDINGVQQAAGTDVVSTPGVQIYLIPLKMDCSTLSVRKALTLSSRAHGNHPALGVALDQFVNLSGSSGATQMRKAQHDRSQTRNFHGVYAFSEPSIRIRVNHDENVLLASENTQTSVYLQSQFKTLADFVTEHCSAFSHALKSSEMLTTMLKGVHVQIGTAAGRECHTVMGFAPYAISDVPKSQQHPSWPSEGGLTLSPYLPLVNIGTIREPCFLPMEVCQILDQQLLHGPRDVGLQCYMNKVLRDRALADLPEPRETVQGYLSFDQLPNENKLDDRLIEVCGGRFPNLLFVEAGSTQTDSSLWDKLRDVLAERVRQSFEKSASSDRDSVPWEKRGSSMPVVSLQYNEYTNEADLASKWTQRLRSFLDNHRVEMQQTIVIVWLEPEQDLNKIYKVIKRACDVKLGVQTYFVKHNNLEANVNTASRTVDPIVRTTGNICRRICQKNPHIPMAIDFEHESKLVIAMHVSLVSTAPQRGQTSLGPQSNPEVYLVTLVSRALNSSTTYHTERRLFDKSQFEAYTHVSLLQELLNPLPRSAKRNIIILRSGHMAGSSYANMDESPCGLDLTDSASFDESSDRSTKKEAVSSQTIAIDVAGEMEAITRVLEPSGSDLLAYVTLTEDSVLKTRLGSEIDNKHRTSDILPAVVFIHDKLLVEAESIKVQQIVRVRADQSYDKAPETRSGAITATFHRRLLADIKRTKNVQPDSDSSLTTHSVRTSSEIPSRSKHADPIGKPRPQHRSAVPDLAQDVPGTSALPRTEVRDPAPYRLQSTEIVQDAGKASVPTSISHMSETSELKDIEADIDTLISVWKDDGLGLYGTKWPVPTHLARLAAKRALVHLGTDDNHANGGPDSPFSLPEVHNNVRDTLYYL